MANMNNLNKKIDLLIVRQNFLAKTIFCTSLSFERAKKMEEKWNKLWKEIMEEEE